MATTVKVRLVKSRIGATRVQRESLRGLGLRNISDQRELIDSPALRGLIARVNHLVAVDAGGSAAKPRAPKAAPKE